MTPKKCVLNSSGNVGIGTSSPNAKLEVAGTQFLSGEVFNYDGTGGSGNINSLGC